MNKEEKENFVVAAALIVFSFACGVVIGMIIG